MIENSEQLIRLIFDGISECDKHEASIKAQQLILDVNDIFDRIKNMEERLEQQRAHNDKLRAITLKIYASAMTVKSMLKNVDMSNKLELEIKMRDAFEPSSLNRYDCVRANQLLNCMKMMLEEVKCIKKEG